MTTLLLQSGGRNSTLSSIQEASFLEKVSLDNDAASFHYDIVLPSLDDILEGKRKLAKNNAKKTQLAHPCKRNQPSKPLNESVPTAAEKFSLAEQSSPLLQDIDNPFLQHDSHESSQGSEDTEFGRPHDVLEGSMSSDIFFDPPVDDPLHSSFNSTRSTSSSQCDVMSTRDPASSKRLLTMFFDRQCRSASMNCVIGNDIDARDSDKRYGFHDEDDVVVHTVHHKHSRRKSEVSAPTTPAPFKACRRASDTGVQYSSPTRQPRRLSSESCSNLSACTPPPPVSCAAPNRRVLHDFTRSLSNKQMRRGGTSRRRRAGRRNFIPTNDSADDHKPTKPITPLPMIRRSSPKRIKKTVARSTPHSFLGTILAFPPAPEESQSTESCLDPTSFHDSPAAA